MSLARISWTTLNDTGTIIPGSSGSGASAIRIRNSRSRSRATISRAVFFLGNSPNVSSMYWISSAPVSSGYCLIRYSNGAALKRPFYNAEVSQRAAGERVRWLSALLILAGILGTSAIVRLWPADPRAVLLASRPIHLFAAPVLPRATLEQLPTGQQVPAVRSVRLHPSTTARGALSRVEGRADRVSPATAGDS